MACGTAIGNAKAGSLVLLVETWVARVLTVAITAFTFVRQFVLASDWVLPVCSRYCG